MESQQQQQQQQQPASTASAAAVALLADPLPPHGVAENDSDNDNDSHAAEDDDDDSGQQEMEDDIDVDWDDETERLPRPFDICKVSGACFGDFICRMKRFRNNDQVEQLARAIRDHGNRNGYHDINFIFSGDDADTFPSNWRPLLHVLETLKLWERVSISCIPTANHLLPLFRDHFFQSLQLNSNIRSLRLGNIDFSNNCAGGLVSYLGAATSLKELAVWERCTNGSILATALQCNTSIETLKLCRSLDSITRSRGNVILLPILQMLASPNAASSRVTRIAYSGGSSIPSEEVSRAFQQCFLSNFGGASIQSVSLFSLVLNQNAASTTCILDGLAQSTTVKKVEFMDCRINIGPHVHQDSQIAVKVANLVRNKLNLETLLLSSVDFCQYDVFNTALEEALCRPKSKLCCLKLDLRHHPNHASITVPAFRSLITAATRSVQLVRLDIGGLQQGDDAYVEALVEAIPLLKIKEFTLANCTTFEALSLTRDQKANLLEAFKKNYVLQNVQCLGLETQLEFCLNRNRKLAE